MSKQTAVEWLAFHLKNNTIATFKSWEEYLERAIEMEREQIIEACEESRDELGITNGNKYYEETYGKEAGHE